MSSEGEDYAAARAVPDSVLQRWPRARLVKLYKESPTMQRTNGSNSCERIGGSLGFNILGGDGTDGIYVSHIHPDRPAARSKAMSVGDRLLVVNGVEVVESSHEEAAILLKTAPCRVDLVLAYCPAEYKKLEEQVRSQTEGQSDNGEEEQNGIYNTRDTGPHNRHSIEADGLFIRVLADFDPYEVMEANQVIPRAAISIRSGDVLQLLNVSDREWWQARIIHPSTCKPLGAAGLVPSRRRLERQERAKWALRFGRELYQPPQSPSRRASSSGTTSSDISDPQSTDKAIESIPLSQSDAPSTSSKQTSMHDAASIDGRRHKLSVDSKKTPSRRALSAFGGEILPPSYIPVTAIQAVTTRPVIIMGDLKHNITKDLLTAFPDDFKSCVPHTTRPRRHGEVNGRDYHFVKSRTRMESEIQMNRYIEAGEYKGNLYGTHINSVFKIASTGHHCLLDVGVLALQRLAAAGLPPITIFVLSDLPDQSLRVVDPSAKTTKQEEINPYRRLKRQDKNFAFLKENAPLMTAVLFVDEYDNCIERIQKVVNDNRGPNVWTPSNDFLP
nr:disks large 1 [Hymenolepis microstoma]